MNDTLHIRPVLRRAWEQPFSPNSRFSRDTPANMSAMLRAVELGFLTTRRGADTWTNRVHITPAGLAYLNPLTYAPTPDDNIQEDNE